MVTRPSTMIVYCETLCVSAARTASRTAIHKAVRTLYRRSQRPVGELSCSITTSVDIALNRTTLVP